MCMHCFRFFARRVQGWLIFALSECDFESRPDYEQGGDVVMC
jgi:hypothetical protein